MICPFIARVLKDILSYQELGVVRIGVSLFSIGLLSTVLLINAVHACGAALAELFIIRDDFRASILCYPALVRAWLLFTFLADDTANQSGSIHCLGGHTTFIL